MIARRSVLAGVIAAALLVSLYTAVLTATAGWSHLIQQARTDGWLLLPLLAGFGVQVALMLELRRRHRLMHTAAASVGTGTGMSAAGMLACCAHHLAELAPIAGAAGVAAFLTDVQRPLMIAGVVVNGIAIAVAVRALRRTARPTPAGASCAV